MIGFPSANLTRAKALVPWAFGAQLALRLRCLVRKQYKTESLTKTMWGSCDNPSSIVRLVRVEFNSDLVSRKINIFTSHNKLYDAKIVGCLVVVFV